MLNKVTFRATLITLCAMLSAGAYAIADAPKQVNIPAGELSVALLKLSKHYGAELVYRPEQVYGLKTRGAHGSLTTEQAVTQLLQGTLLELRTDSSGAMLIAPPIDGTVQGTNSSQAPNATRDASDDSKETGKKNSSQDFRVAQVDQGTNSQSSSVGSNPSATKESPSIGLEEIVVTAQKRAENLRDVPASISALTYDEITAQHIESTDDLTRAVPGISFSPNTGNGAGVGVGSENLMIRGIGSAVGSATVGMYVDEVPVTQLIQAGTFSPKLFDLDRVEVLRGPQGTLYGASSEGGTVRFITKQPNVDDFEGVVSANVSHTQSADFNTDGKAVLNMPLIEHVLAVRAGVEVAQNSGWIDRYAHNPGDLTTASNTLLRKNVNAERDLVVRLSAKYQPDATLSITPSFMYQKEHQDDSPAYFLNAGLYRQAKSVAEFADDLSRISSLTIEKGLGFADLTSVTSYFSRRFDRGRDGTFFDSDYVVPAFLDTDPRTAAQQPIADLTLAMLPVTATDNEHATAFNQEIRLASPAGDKDNRRLNWVVGLYFSDNVDTLIHDEQVPGWNSLFQSIYGFSVNDPVRSPLANPADPTTWQDSFLHSVTRTEAKQYAVFGQLDYEILPKLRASAGLRYQVSNLTYSFNGKGYYDIGIDNVNADHAKDVALTPKFALSYSLTSTANIYVSAAKGYRDAGFNVPVPQAVCGPNEKQIGLSGNPPSSYAPDQLWSYELGFKALLADNQLSINADVYDIRWSKIQQQIVIPVCAFDYTSNVGAAEAYGSELEVLYRLPFVAGLTLGVNASVEHATITATNANSVAAVGDRLLYTPAWSATFSATYAKPISRGLSLFVRADNYWQGRSYGDFQSNTTDYINRQYSVLNSSFGITTANGFEVQIFAKNLLDKTTVIREPTIAAVTEAYTLPPRIVGIEAKKKF
jgi:iron complex outermembrane receptor protein